MLRYFPFNASFTRLSKFGSMFTTSDLFHHLDTRSSWWLFHGNYLSLHLPVSQLGRLPLDNCWLGNFQRCLFVTVPLSATGRASHGSLGPSRTLACNDDKHEVNRLSGILMLSGDFSEPNNDWHFLRLPPVIMIFTLRYRAPSNWPLPFRDPGSARSFPIWRAHPPSSPTDWYAGTKLPTSRIVPSPSCRQIRGPPFFPLCVPLMRVLLVPSAGWVGSGCCTFLVSAKSLSSKVLPLSNHHPSLDIVCLLGTEVPSSRHCHRLTVPLSSNRVIRDDPGADIFHC